MTQKPRDLFSLENKIALVTGGASGIGAAIASVLAEAGALLIIADINQENAEREVAKIIAAGHRAAAVAINLAEENSIVNGCAKVISHFGTPWILINNAGLQDRQAFLASTADEWDLMNRINARGPFLMTRELARAMIAAGQGGRIVNIASAVLRGSIVRGLAAYASSKGALLGLSGATAFELAEHGITVNTVLPGGVPTPGAIAAKGPAPEGPGRRSLPLGMCEPQDIAAAVLYFASPSARRVTNQVLAVDGGFSIT
jgi:NAD(P)-dependent dehydrogenase (short-subunit alcohol dehydrogenase family)